MRQDEVRSGSEKGNNTLCFENEDDGSCAEKRGGPICNRYFGRAGKLAPNTIHEGMNTSIRVLVVDDARNVCDAVKRGLEQTQKYVVHMATTGIEAIAIACELLPDVILLDMMMPMMTGAECAKRLRETPRTAHIPVIYLTGMICKDDAKAYGGIIDGERYLAKPICIDEIMQAVEAALSEKQMGHAVPW